MWQVPVQRQLRSVVGTQQGEVRPGAYTAVTSVFMVSNTQNSQVFANFSMYTIESLANLLLDNKRVAFSFIDESKGGERNFVSCREADDWDRIDSQVEDNAEVDGDDFYVIGHPRSGEIPHETNLVFKNTSEAGNVVVSKCISLKL
jgi:hypothetical protein